MLEIAYMLTSDGEKYVDLEPKSGSKVCGLFRTYFKADFYKLHNVVRVSD